MIMAALSSVWAFLSKIPREVWYVLLALGIVWFAYHKGGSDEAKEWEARLELAAEEQKRKAAEARATADANSQHRADEHEEQSETLKKVVEDAKASNDNPVDALISSLSEAD